MVSNEQRRKQLARQKYLRQQARRAQSRRRARIRNSVIGTILAVALGAGAAATAAGAFSGDDDSDSVLDKAKESASPTPSSKAPDPCDEPAKGKPGKKQWKKEPEMSIDTSASYTMELATTCGEIAIELDAENAPRTVNSFHFLAGEGYFDHTECHRLVTEGIHVLQCGDPTATGQGNPGYTIPDENLEDPRLKDGVYPAGTVAMANSYNPQTDQGKNSGGSQFFLVYKDSKLPAYYTPFGKVTKGMDVLKKVAKAGTSPDPATGVTVPNATVVIDEATVAQG